MILNPQIKGKAVSFERAIPTPLLPTFGLSKRDVIVHDDSVQTSTGSEAIWTPQRHVTAR